MKNKYFIFNVITLILKYFYELLVYTSDNKVTTVYLLTYVCLIKKFHVGYFNLQI